MSLSLYLDDCAFSYRLLRTLRESGHVVQTPTEVTPPLTGAKDEVHFEYAVKMGFVVLTYNPGDFLRLHQQQPEHSGIFAIYQDNNLFKDMTPVDIVRAIGNLQETGVVIAGGFWVLNAYQW